MNLKALHKINDSVERQEYLDLISELSTEFESKYNIYDGWETPGSPIVIGFAPSFKRLIHAPGTPGSYHQAELEAMRKAIDEVKSYIEGLGYNVRETNELGFIYLD